MNKTIQNLMHESIEQRIRTLLGSDYANFKIFFRIRFNRSIREDVFYAQENGRRQGACIYGTGQPAPSWVHRSFRHPG